MNFLKKFFSEEKGQGLTEYGLILGLLAVGVVAILVIMGGHLTTIFTSISDHLETGAGNASP
jgi:pilus assembly protein Flp/PilA